MTSTDTLSASFATAAALVALSGQYMALSAEYRDALAFASGPIDTCERVGSLRAAAKLARELGDLLRTIADKDAPLAAHLSEWHTTQVAAAQTADPVAFADAAVKIGQRLEAYLLELRLLATFAE